MRIFMLIVISFIFFFLLITGISLFIPSQIRISKAIDISADKDSVFNQISKPANWKNWYPGADTSNLFIENDTVKGIITGGKQALIIRAVDDSAVDAISIGSGLQNVESGWNILASPQHEIVTVQWFMDFHLRWYPWEKFSSLMFEPRYGPRMEQGLQKLKRILEK